MDLVVVLELSLFVILLGFSGFFSSSETALFSLSRLDLQKIRRELDPNGVFMNQHLRRVLG